MTLTCLLGHQFIVRRTSDLSLHNAWIMWDNCVASPVPAPRQPYESRSCWWTGIPAADFVCGKSQAFEEASGKKVEYKLVDRRAGDSVAVWAATDTAEKELGWKAKLNILDMCKDQWKWASLNPKGYES